MAANDLDIEAMVLDLAALIPARPAGSLGDSDEDTGGPYTCAWCGKPTEVSPTVNVHHNFAKPSLHVRGCEIAWKDDQCFNTARANLKKYAAHYACTGLSDPVLLERVSDTVKHVASMRQLIEKEGSGILLGDTGHGKSSLAVAGLCQVLKAGRRAKRDSEAWRTAVGVRFYPARVLAKRRSQNPLGRGEPDEVTDALGASILLLDELGSEMSDFKSAIADVIMDRYDTGRPIWVTTGCSPGELVDRYGAAFGRRLVERGMVIQFGNESKQEAVKV